MDNKLIILRHARTQIDKNVPIAKWVLSSEGALEAQKLSDSDIFGGIDVLLSSDEDKSYLTIKPIADKLGKQIERVPDIGEISRPGSEKLAKEEYEDMKKSIFVDLNYTKYGWETANHALSRFGGAIKRIDREHDGKKILVCSHGTVMTLYFAALQDKMPALFERWEKLDFGSYDIIENGNVVKDII